jgi:hypothetical protein
MSFADGQGAISLKSEGLAKKRKRRDRVRGRRTTSRFFYPDGELRGVSGAAFFLRSKLM